VYQQIDDLKLGFDYKLIINYAPAEITLDSNKSFPNGSPVKNGNYYLHA
jgi:hypothetical protein